MSFQSPEIQLSDELFWYFYYWSWVGSRWLVKKDMRVVCLSLKLKIRQIPL